MDRTPPTTADDRRAPGSASTLLGFWDAVSVIVGIVVGASIFKVPADVFNNVSGPWQGLGVWLLGGALSLVGALCYAELATTYPRSGGDYVYLTRAFGPLSGFLFGWARLGGILTGSIGAMAYVFADHAVDLFGIEREANYQFAIGGVLVLTLVNMGGVSVGKTAQNVLTVLKVFGLSGIVLVGFVWGGGYEAPTSVPVEASGASGTLGMALIFVLYAYGGWNDSAYVAAEIRDPRRNVPRALCQGIAAITVIYLLVNAGILYGLGFEGGRSSRTPAADVLALIPGEWSPNVIRVLVMVSALGALNGMLFTGSRVHASMGADHRLFAWLGKWNTRTGAPVWALATEGAISILLILAIGTQAGRGSIDALFERFGASLIPWEKFEGGFSTLVIATAPIFWLFFLLTGVSLFVLRVKDAGRDRPFSVPLYPWTPLVFCGTSIYMLYASIDYARSLSLIVIAPLLLGLPVYAISRSMNRRATQ